MTLDVVDQAMLARWKALFENTFLVNRQSTEELEARNKIQKDGPVVNQTEQSVYPMFTIQRVGIPVIQKTNMKQVHQGEKYPEKELTKAGTWFLLRYQLDILSTEKKNFDELLIEVQESLIRDPFFTCVTGDEDLGSHNFTLTLEDVEDLSDVETMVEHTPVYRAAVIYTTEVMITRRYERLQVREIKLDYYVKGASQ